MEGTKVAPEEWLGQWLAMLDRRHPGWRNGYDSEAFGIAVTDALGDGSGRPVGADELEVLGEFTLGHDEETAGLYREALEKSGRFRRAMIEFEYIFRASHGSSRASPELREMRRRVMAQIVEAILEPLAARLVRIDRAREMRERRRARRHPLIADASPVADAEAAGPEVEVLGREAAERVARRAREEFSPQALAAIRAFFLDPERRSACEAAAEAGISPATLSRALQRLRAIAAEELQGCRDSVLRPFTTALFDRWGAA